jgi:hypothetical protein
MRWEVVTSIAMVGRCGGVDAWIMFAEPSIAAVVCDGDGGYNGRRSDDRMT